MMEDLLLQLLNSLEHIGDEHEELYDTECRNRMSNAVMEGFVRNNSTLSYDGDFGLHTASANLSVEKALAKYIADAKQKASELSIDQFHDRLAAFQNSSVKSDRGGNYYDDFFSYSDPDAFDSAGNVLHGLDDR